MLMTVASTLSQYNHSIIYMFVNRKANLHILGNWLWLILIMIRLNTYVQHQYIW